MSIFSFIAELFQNIFSAVRKAWNHLPEAVRDRIKNGSGIISILSQYIGQDPKLTIATIQANFNVDLDALYSSLSVLAKFWGLTIPETLEDLVVVVQNYLKTLESSEWDRILSTGAQIVADVLTGSSTPFGIISSVIEFVYSEFIKGKDLVLGESPAVATVSEVVG